MARLSTIFMNGQVIQLDRYSDVEFVIVDGVLVAPLLHGQKAKPWKERL